MHRLKLSVVIPAYNEAETIPKTVGDLQRTLDASAVPFEIIIVNDNSRDETGAVIDQLQQADPRIRRVDRTPPGGFGRAIRSGLEAVTGDAVVICMADQSDDPADVLAYYRKLEEGYDAVFGSRFIKGSKVERYPWFKLIVNRIVNRMIQLMFWCKFNDLTNAFKAYRTEVIRACGPYHGCHFNLTIEMSLSALIREYNIAQIPINWYGRTWGSSNLSLGKMGRRYLETLIRAFAERMLIRDDLLAERLANRRRYEDSIQDLVARVERLERCQQPESLPLKSGGLGQNRHAA